MAFLGLLVVLFAAGCSSGASSTFTVKSASVDSSYFCPGGAKDAPYDLHAIVQVHNGTDRNVTIDGVTAQMTLASVKGPWLEKVGDRYNADKTTFTPAAVASGKDAAVMVTIPSACTSGAYGTGTSSSADYNVTIHLATSAGSFAVTAGNRHEIVAD